MTAASSRTLAPDEGAAGPSASPSAGPSAWSHRLPAVGLAVIGGLIASYLAAFQVGLVAAPWDPVFGSASSEHVLTSGISRSLPLPDAAFGALAYAADVVLGLAGGTDRWRRRPWLVIAFGVVVAALALTGIGLTLAQATVIGSFCALCLASAAISLGIAAFSAEEVLAGVERLRERERRAPGWTSPGSAAAASVSPGSAAAASVSPGNGAAASAHEMAGMTPRADPPAFRSVTDRATDERDPALQGASGKMAERADASRHDSAEYAPRTEPRAALIAPGPDRDPGRSQHMGKVVVITGASAGVGRATVRTFAKDGWDVGLIARNQEALENAADEVRREGGRALVLPLDVADADAVEAAAERVERELGPIDAWVNDAMLSVFSPVKEMKPEEYRRVTEVTYLGYVHGTLAALKRMLPRDEGVIVQVGSALAYRGIPLQSAYCAAKHAIEGFCDSLWAELIHDGSHVKLTVVEMPALNTPQFGWVKSRLPNKAQPVPPIFQPEVAAAAILYAAKHPRRELFVGRSTDLAIYANKIVPGVLDWYLGKTGYKSQQTDQPEDPERPNNLWGPVPGDQGAHGRFDDRAQDWSPQLWAATHRPAVAAGLAAVAAVALMAGRMVGGLAGERHG